MKIITKNSDYAIRAITYLAGKNEKASVADMSRDLGIPGPFLRKILQKLNINGILSSSKEKGGGFILTLPPERIRLKDIVRIFQGPIKAGDCAIKSRTCPDTMSCLLRGKIAEIRTMVDTELDSITLDTIIHKE